MAAHPKAVGDGSTILIVGASSFVGAHIVLAFLSSGYKVRATDYEASKATWLTEDAFKSYADSSSLELVIVSDITADNAFANVVRGVSAFIYVANVAVQLNPNDTIPQNVAGILNALRAATKEPSIRRFVMTSSYAVEFTPNPSPDARLDSKSWNLEALERAWAPPPYENSRFSDVSMASKVQAEQALWKFVDDENLPFGVNTVLPGWITGKLFSTMQNPSSILCLLGLYNNDPTWLRSLQIHSYVSVRDVAMVHVGAAIDSNIAGERIYAIAEHTDWNDFLAILRRLYPEKKFMDDMPDLGRFRGEVDTSLARGMLKKWGARDAWVPLEDGIKDTFDYEH
ncbi:NAD(P)-binding protein [Thozetella sp. PMI_491]|nr:NAD(P)-binding protein [Thozetella sp. PMI_491]